MDSRARNIEKAFAAVINDKKLPEGRTSEEINSIKAHLQENLFSADFSRVPQTGQIIIISQTFDGDQHDILYRLGKIDTSITADYGYVYSLVPVTEEELLTDEQQQEYKDSFSMSYEACTHLLLIGRWNNTTVNNIKSCIEEKKYSKLVITASDEWQPAVELLKEHCPYVEKKDFLPFNIRKPFFSYLASKLKQELVDLKNDIKAKFNRVVNFISSTLRPPALQLPPTPPPIPSTLSLPPPSHKREVSRSISIATRKDPNKGSSSHLLSRRQLSQSTTSSLQIHPSLASTSPLTPSSKSASSSTESSASPRKISALSPLASTLSPPSSNRSASHSSFSSIEDLDLASSSKKRSFLFQDNPSSGYFPSSRVPTSSTPPNSKTNSF